MKIKRIALGLTIGWLSFAAAQVEFLASELLAQARQYHGGDAFDEVKSLRGLNTVVFYDTAGQEQLRIEIETLVDVQQGRIRFASVVPALGESVFHIMQYAPGASFEWTPRTGTVALTQQSAEALRMALYTGLFNLKYRDAERERASYDGRLTVAGVEGRAVSVVTQGVPVTLLLDEAGRVLAEKVRDPQFGEFWTVYDDYRQIAGLLLPWTAWYYQGETAFGRVLTTRFDVNPVLTGADFALP
jgi:hypothetical protein